MNPFMMNMMMGGNNNKNSSNPFPQAPQQRQLTQKEQQQQLMEILKSNPQLMKKYQQQLSKFQHQSKNKTNNHNNKPLTNKQYIQKVKSKQIDSFIDQQGGLVIQPDSGFVLKFFQKRSNQKIFINITKHEVVDHPQQKALLDLDNQSGLRIPMSMGRVKDETDKNGNPCKVVDCVLNPKIVETAQTNLDIMMFMAQIIGNYLLEKYKITISDQQMKKVKGLKYKGTSVQLQRVKGKKNPKIQQIQKQSQKTSEQIDKQQQLFNKLNNQNQQKRTIQPQFKLYTIDKNNKKQAYSYDTNLDTIQQIEILLDMSHLIHSKGIHLQGSDRLLYLEVRNIYELCLKIPIAIGKWNGVFSRKDRKLLIIGIPKNKLQEKQKIQKKIIINDKTSKQNTQKQQKKKQKINIEMQNDLLYDIV